MDLEIYWILIPHMFGMVLEGIGKKSYDLPVTVFLSLKLHQFLSEVI